MRAFPTDAVARRLTLVCRQVSTIESLYEDEKFENRELAALIASKVFYHLGDESLDDSVGYALGAGSLFDVHSKEEYFETLVSRCIDQYIQQRVVRTPIRTQCARRFRACVQALADGKPEAKPIDPRLEAVVEKMFERKVPTMDTPLHAPESRSYERGR